MFHGCSNFNKLAHELNVNANYTLELRQKCKLWFWNDPLKIGAKVQITVQERIHWNWGKVQIMVLECCIEISASADYGAGRLQNGGAAACNNCRLVALIPREASSTAAGIWVSSNWLAVIKKPGNWELRLLKVTAGPLPTLIWKCTVPLGKM